MSSTLLIDLIFNLTPKVMADYIEEFSRIKLVGS
jgi:hypothetical protein